MPYGLKDIELEKLSKVFAANERIERVILYGSRAKGNYKPFSDVDITLEGAELTHNDLSRLSLVIDDLLLPYQFDISIFHTLKNEALIDHIRRMGITIYEKESEWKEYKLGEIASFKTGKLNSNAAVENGAYPFFTCSPVTLSINEYAYDQKAILLAVNNAEGNFSIKYYEGKFNAYQRTYIIESQEDLCNLKYLYYSLKICLQEFKNISQGTSTRFLTAVILNNFQIILPTLPTQHRIAAILSSLDDKIDLLNRENATLEAMAETLFRQWFIEEAREDWEEGKLGDEFAFTMGQSPSGDSCNEDGIGMPMYQGNADFGFRFPTQRIYTTQPTRVAEVNDTLISVRAPVGAQNMAKEKCSIGRGVAAFRYKNNPAYFSYKLKSLLEEIKQFNDNGTVFGSISKSDFDNFNISIPDEETIMSFQQQVEAIDCKIINNNNEIQTLAQARNGLLPKLMSDEMKI